MKNTFFITITTVILSLFSAGHVFAQTPVSKEMAQKYYEGCLNSPDAPDFSKETMRSFCACTAARMMQSLSVEDIQASGQQGEKQLPALHKMIISVHAPCLHYPYREQKYKTCMSDPKTRRLSTNPDKLCRCLSDKTAKYLERNAQQVFKRILAKTPTISDPLAALESDKDFLSYAKRTLPVCLF